MPRRGRRSTRALARAPPMLHHFQVQYHALHHTKEEVMPARKKVARRSTKKRAPVRKKVAAKKSAKKSAPKAPPVPQSAIGLLNQHMDYTTHKIGEVKRFYTEVLG